MSTTTPSGGAVPSGGALSSTSAVSATDLAQRHRVFGWWSLLVFATLGLALETLHGLKLGFYLDVQNETRRLLWTLAHAHGVLLSLLHLFYASTLRAGQGAAGMPGRLTSRLLVAATLLLPAGFFLGGILVYGGDPNSTVLLSPLGAVLLLWALLRIARAAMVRPGTE